MLRKLISVAIVVVLGASDAHATVIGVTVESLVGADKHLEVGATEFRSALGADAVVYYIPLTSSPSTCTFGPAGCGTSSDTGSGGTVMSMFIKFDGVSTTESSFLEILFEDLDLIDANDPFGFFETVEVLNSAGGSLTGRIENISNDLVTGNRDTQQLLSFGLGVLGPTPLWLELKFSASYIHTGTNTPEYLIATVTSVPEPAPLSLLGLGFLGLWIARRRSLLTWAV